MSNQIFWEKCQKLRELKLKRLCVLAVEFRMLMVKGNE